MVEIEAGSDEWLGQVQEDIIDPERLIIDPHHHLWKKRFGRNYLLPELWGDTGSGHNIVKTLFVECMAFYYREGPDHLRPVGETEYITDCCKQSALDPNNATVAGIIAHADLELAGESEEKLIEALHLHTVKSEGLLRGIRHSGARDQYPKDLFIPGHAPPSLYEEESFRKGLSFLAGHGLTYDTWHYHHQNSDFLNLARNVPETTMVLDHFGTPLGVGIYRNRKDEIFHKWKQEISDIARCENVYAKLGGLAMPDNGFDWHKAKRPPSSDQFLKAQEKYYMHTIECFGPERCMFESNFPVDRLSINYHVLWNAFKKMTADFSEDEKHALFYGTAEKVYSLQA